MKQADIMERALILQGGVLDLLMQENVALKKKIAEPKWKAGHPEHEEPVLVHCSREGRCWYQVTYWDKKMRRWIIYNQDSVLGWKEIEPFDLALPEVGE